MKGSVFGPTNFPLRRRGSNPGPLAQEASALTTRLPRDILGRSAQRLLVSDRKRKGKERFKSINKGRIKTDDRLK